MSMTQLVMGTALGFFVAQGVLYGIKHLIGWLQRSVVATGAKPSAFIARPRAVELMLCISFRGRWSIGIRTSS